MTLPHDADTVVPRHAEDETLLAYLDGELDSAAFAQTASHLEQCWRCRSRANVLESSIREFLTVREQVLPTDVAPDGRAEANFRNRLSAHAADVLPRPTLRAGFDALRYRLMQIVGRFAPAPALRYALAGVVTCALVAIAVTTWWTMPVSAEEIVGRTEVRELFDIRCSNLVVRSVVNIDRVDGASTVATRLGVIETHTDPSSAALSVSIRMAGVATLERAVLWGRDSLEDRQPVAGVLPEQLARFFKSHRWAPGVSIPGYLRLVADRGDTRVLARRTGSLFEVSYPFAAGHPSSIVEARLCIDAERWLPTQVRLFTRDASGSHEFRFTREALEFLPRTPDFARLFALARPAVAAGRAEPGRRAASLAALPDATMARRSLPLSWDSVQASDREVAVAAVLHTLGADLGEEVNIFPMSDGTVMVQGLVDTDSRRQAIEQALRQLPAPLVVEIHTPADLRTGAELFDQPWRTFTDVEAPDRPATGTPVRMVDAGGLRLPMQKRLEEHFARGVKTGGAGPSSQVIGRAVSAFSNDVVSRSRQALFHSWALYRLEQQFSPARTGALLAPSLDAVAAIRRSHRDAVVRIARELAALLDPLTGSRGQAARTVGPEPDAQTLLRLVSDADALVRELFTVSAEGADPALSLSRLAVLLEHLG